MEILAAELADHFGDGDVVVEVVGHLLVERLERWNGTRKVDGSEGRIAV